MNALLPPEYWQLEQALTDDEELIVDSFAGGGGASTGIEMALGRSPDFAINHDAQALDLHRVNHPGTVHLNSNIYHVDPRDVVGRRKVGLLWASPDCKDFSKAKGGTPVRKHIRGLAWTVVLWIERARPRVIILENVEEFQQWGPVIDGPKGPMPDPERRGETFKEWTAAIRKHGYKVDWRELRACDYGAPTSRKRLFLIARCDGQPIVWPEPTHGDPTDPEVIAGRKLPWRTAAEIIDWSQPCPSIFDTAEEIWEKFGVRAVRPLAGNTEARIYKGYERYVANAAKPYIVTYNHGGDWFRGQGLETPFHTVTAARDAHGLVVPHFSAAQHGGSMREADAPLRTIAASDKDQHQLVAAHLMTMRNAGKPFNEVDKPTHTITAGGAGLSLVETKIEKVAAFLAQHNTGMVGHSLDKPLSTILQRGTQQAVVSAGLLNQKGTAQANVSIHSPLPTICAGAVHAAEVRAFLMKYYGADQDPRLEEPLATITTKDRFGLVTVEGVDYQVVDIGMRMLTPRELFKAQGFPDDYRIDAGMFADGEIRTLTKTAQVRMCGNSVCPPIAAALVAANCSDLARQPVMEAAE
ncbi:MAG TPA: DNA cytosine methyltransferase [Devosia sp.]|nr:DNA cytosine methyltransferase [Devosia sp.]